MSSLTVRNISLGASLFLLSGYAATLCPQVPQQANPAAPPVAAPAKQGAPPSLKLPAPATAADKPAKTVPQKIDLRAAMNVNLPASARDLEPASFNTPDGKSGWVLRLPGNRPIATPAYADGMLFVGGGYSSHEFYAVDADTGKIIWKIQTGDDGPTAAVVADGMVAFNTESCTLVIVDERRGRVIWQEWLAIR